MKREQQSSIVIIGGGVAGWFVARELARRSIACIIIDTTPPAAYASTRNQGWLQSGALYAATGDPVAAQYCWSGYHFIRSHYPHVIRTGIPGYFLFSRKAERDLALDRCHEQGIAIRPVPFQQVRRHETLLMESSLAFSAEVPDVPLDTSLLLQDVANEACHYGAQFCPVETLASIRIESSGNRRRVWLDHNRAIACNGIMLACGAYIPEMLETVLPGQGSPFKRTKNPVLVLHGKIAHSMLIALPQLYSPHLIPFNGAAGDGASVCLYQADEVITEPGDRLMTAEHLAKYQEVLGEFYGGLKKMVSQKRCQAHMYGCQKLALGSTTQLIQHTRGPVVLSYALPGEAHKSLFVFYPGKFTATPIVVRECIDEMEKHLGNLRGAFALRQGTFAPEIAKQRYYDHPEYSVGVTNEKITFEPF